MSADGYFKTTANYNDGGHPKLLKYADGALSVVRNQLLASAKGPLLNVARTTITSLMQRIERGRLRVLTPSGIYTFGDPNARIWDERHPNPDRVNGKQDETLTAEIKVIDEIFWARMLVLSDLGFAESFMAGEILVDDLDALFKLFIINRESLSELSTGAASHIFRALSAMTNSRYVNSLTNAISNISAHYDISNKMFASFLSPDMTYSCAVWPTETGGVTGDLDNPAARAAALQAGRDELETAQLAKLHAIIDRAQLSPGDRVLEIGSGWGSLAIEAVNRSGCVVDTLTLSVEQKVLAEERIAAAGLSDKITVHLLDYRSLPESWHHQFDRVVSIEMIEAVGKEFLDGYFTVLDQALRKDRGLAVIQVITMPEGRFEAYSNSVDFIQKYIFPGGFLPSVTYLIDAIQRGAHGRLIVDNVTNIGPHYARTLREWRKRFEHNFEEEIVPALKEAHPELRQHGRRDIDIFKRKWIYYFVYCETGFSMRALGDHIVTMTREGNLSMSA